VPETVVAEFMGGRVSLASLRMVGVHDDAPLRPTFHDVRPRKVRERLESQKDSFLLDYGEDVDWLIKRDREVSMGVRCREHRDPMRVCPVHR
jgi:hypothetical protein